MTSLESSRAETERYKTGCRTILALSPKIRYVGIINRFGRTLVGQLRKDVTPLFKTDEARNEFFIEAMRNHLRKSFESSIGRTEYTFTENEKVKILTLSNETNNFYYITFDKDTTPEDVGTIIQMIKKLAGS